MNKKSHWYSINPIRLIGVVASILFVGLIGLVIMDGFFDTACGCGGPSSAKGWASSNLAQIAKTFAAYSQSSADGRVLTAKPGDTAHNAAVILSRGADLNDASFWFIWSDPALAGKPHPKSVIIGDSANGTLDSNFAKLQLSYVFAANIPLNAPVETTPVVWTRGLQPDGTWSKDSPWVGKGGHIAFLDGHVEWYDYLSLKPDEPGLVKYGTTTPTTDIREALPPGAIILPAEPAKTP
jgi:prepilin-type processing-associated H-X9-DG protein